MYIHVYISPICKNYTCGHTNAYIHYVIIIIVYEVNLVDFVLVLF